MFTQRACIINDEKSLTRDQKELMTLSCVNYGTELEGANEKPIPSNEIQSDLL